MVGCHDVQAGAVRLLPLAAGEAVRLLLLQAERSLVLLPHEIRDLIEILLCPVVLDLYVVLVVAVVGGHGRFGEDALGGSALAEAGRGCVRRFRSLVPPRLRSQALEGPLLLQLDRVGQAEGVSDQGVQLFGLPGKNEMP